MGQFVSNVFVTGSTLPAAPAPSTGAGDLVRDGWSDAQGYATSAFNTAVEYLGELENIGNQLVDIPDVTVDMLPITTPVPNFVIPDAITRPDLTPQFPNSPTEPTLYDVPALALPNAPEFTAALPDIDLNITPPSPLTEIPPSAPELNAIVLPDDPSYTLPDVPSLLAINLPAAPILTIPEFTDSLDDLANPPSGSLSFIEPTYSSTLLDGLKEFLEDWVRGAATGLDPDVEQAIWNRAREREDVNAVRGIDTARNNYAGRGFAVPMGAMQIAIMNVMQDAVNKSSGLSREIMVKQAELEQQNRQFAVTTGVQLEGQLLTYSNQVAQRAYEVANAVLRATIDLYQVTVSGYNAKVQAFATKAQVWRQRVEVELSNLEIYKAELEAQKLIGELNVQNVEIYKALLQGVLANVEAYKAQVEAANVKSSINRNIIDTFVARIQAFGELVRAKAVEYDGFASQIKAEVSKADVFKAQADAFKSQVDGYAAMTNAKVSEQGALIKVNQELPLELFQQRVSAFEKLVSAEASRLASLTNAYETDGRVFTSQVQAEASRVNAESDIFRSEVQYVLGDANAQTEVAKANISKMTSALQLLIESIKSGASVSAQLAASALSAVNLSGSISDGSSVSSSTTHSNSMTNNNSSTHNATLSESHTFDETA